MTINAVAVTMQLSGGQLSPIFINEVLVAGAGSYLYTEQGTATTEPNLIPDQFTFIDKSNVPLGQFIQSDPITVTGLTTGFSTLASISGDATSEHRINGGSWITATASVNNGNTIEVRHQSSGLNSFDTNTTLALGPLGQVTDTFTSTTVSTGGLVLVGVSDPTLSTNLNWPDDFNPNFPFIDLIKMSRPFYSDGAITATNEYLRDNNHLDSSGWPISIPPGNTSITTIWDLSNTEGTYLANENMTLSWDGSATVTLSGSNIQNVNSTPNQITFSFSGSGFTGTLQLEISGPYGAAPNNPRNFTLIPDKFQTLYDAGERLNPDHLLINSDMRLVRLMDWNRVNRDNDVPIPAAGSYTWADRTTYDNVQTFGNCCNDFDPIRNTVPLELQVEYCNKTQCDGWFCFFQAADDDYITQYATYVRDNLNANLTAHFELSNEVWNTLFNANAYFLNEGRTAWPGASGVGDLEVALNAQGKRAAEVAILVNAVYAGQESRRVNVLGGIFDDFVAWNEYIAIATTWQAQDPGGYVRPSSVCQAFAYAPYYGFALSTSEAANVAAAYAAGTHIEFIDDYLNNPSTGVIPNLIPSFALQKAFCDSEGLAMLQYEGGRHYLHGGVQGDALTAMLEYSRTENDAANILQMWNAWEEVGDGPMQVYWDVGVHGPFGVFSYAAYYGDTSPYSEILFTLNEYTPNWWGGTGDYRQAPITGATDYRIPTGDSKPLTTESYFHVFGNSTFTYDGGSPAPATSYTRAGEWLGLLAGASSRKSVGSYTFQFYDTWNAYNWGSPASGVQISGNYSIGNTEPWTGDITNSNYTDFINMPSNFFGDEMGQQPFNSPVTTVVTRINNLIDNINSVHADVNHILYAHWADAGPYSVSSTNTRADFTIYNNSQMVDYLDWFIEAQDAVIAGGRPMRMFPVGAIIAWLFENESYLQSLRFYDVYGDDAPHGSENIYLLIAMICYRCIYGSGPDLAAFTIPPAATQIRSEISNNLSSIDAAIRDRLIFHRANGVNV